VAMRTRSPGTDRASKTNALASSIVLAVADARRLGPNGKSWRVRRGAAERASRGGPTPAVGQHRSGRHGAVDDRAGHQGVLALRKGGGVDGSAMSVSDALAIINDVLGEVLDGEEAELDADTRFA
jgi:hypothetical protein